MPAVARRLALAPITALALLPATAGAAAPAPVPPPAAPPAPPKIVTDRDCYLDTTVSGRRTATSIKLTGNGFTPGAPFQVSLDGTPLSGGIGTTDTLGALTGSFTTSPLASLNMRQRTWKVRVDEGGNSAETEFRTSDVHADFTPSSGNPGTLRVNWIAYGFKLDRSPGAKSPTVYAHYIRPNGKRKKTLKLGRATGPCGRMAKTKKRRLFPFRAERGLWRIQIDTNKRYRKGTSSSPFIFYTTGVRIRRVVR